MGIEIDENGHLGRSENKEQKREQIIKDKTGFHIIRINPDKENLDIDDEIGEIQYFIYESGKNSAVQSTKDKIVEDTEKLTNMVK